MVLFEFPSETNAQLARSELEDMRVLCHVDGDRMTIEDSELTDVVTDLIRGYGGRE